MSQETLKKARAQGGPGGWKAKDGQEVGDTKHKNIDFKNNVGSYLEEHRRILQAHVDEKRKARALKKAAAAEKLIRLREELAAARAAAAKPKSLTASHARLRSALRQRDDLDSSEASSSEEDGMELGS